MPGGKSLRLLDDELALDQLGGASARRRRGRAGWRCPRPDGRSTRLTVLAVLRRRARPARTSFSSTLAPSLWVLTMIVAELVGRLVRRDCAVTVAFSICVAGRGLRRRSAPAATCGVLRLDRLAHIVRDQLKEASLNGSSQMRIAYCEPKTLSVAHARRCGAIAVLQR